MRDDPFDEDTPADDAPANLEEADLKDPALEDADLADPIAGEVESRGGPGEAEVTLSGEEADQVAAVLDVCLEIGFDVDDVDREVLERARERLRDRS